MFDWWPSGVAQLEWNFSCSIGDVINLVLASGTIFIAAMAYKIQKTQVKLMEDQTMSSLVLADIARRDKESDQAKLRATIVRNLVDIAGQTIAYKNPMDVSEKVFFVYSNRSADDMLFKEEHLRAMDSILDIHTEDASQYDINNDDKEQEESRETFSENMTEALASFLQSFAPKE